MSAVAAFSILAAHHPYAIEVILKRSVDEAAVIAIS